LRHSFSSWLIYLVTQSSLWPVNLSFFLLGLYFRATLGILIYYSVYIFNSLPSLLPNILSRIVVRKMHTLVSYSVTTKPMHCLYFYVTCRNVECFTTVYIYNMKFFIHQLMYKRIALKRMINLH